VVRLGAMGDVVHTLWAVSALRAALPDMRIGWAVEERWSELLCAKNASKSASPNPQRPVIDTLHTVNTKTWRQSLFATHIWNDVAATFREIRQQHYDVAADFQGAIKSAFMTRFADSGITVGMQSPRESPARWFYKQKVATQGRHVIEQYQSLAEAVAGKALPLMRPEFPQNDEAEGNLKTRVGPLPNLVILNPGAGWGAKQWPAERYGQVAKALASDGMTPILNCSPGEKDLAAAAETASEGKAIAFACSIPELIALTRRARLFIGGDTGPLHLAAALGVSCVALFGPTDPARNGPYGTKSVVLRNPASSTSLSHTNTPDPGLLLITADEVIRAACRLLEHAHG
jgi:heptosyltransferase-1